MGGSSLQEIASKPIWIKFPKKVLEQIMVLEIHQSSLANKGTIAGNNIKDQFFEKLTFLTP